jgi:hypothetical protein
MYNGKCNLIFFAGSISGFTSGAIIAKIESYVDITPTGAALSSIGILLFLIGGVVLYCCACCRKTSYRS